MKLASIITKPQRRGAEVFADDLAHFCRRAGHHARLVALYAHDGEGLALDETYDDVVLNEAEGAASERALNPVLLARLVRTLRHNGPDIVMANGGRALKYAAAARRLTRARSLWVYRNIDRPTFWLRTRAAKLLMPPLVRATFDAAVAVSMATLAEVRSVYGFHDHSVAIENGVDFSRLEGEPAPRGAEPRILCVGALGPQKRFDVAIDVVSRLSTPASLDIIGEGPWRERLEAHAARAGRAVRLLGSRQDVGAQLRGADLLLLTSDTEGIPAVVIEAAHCGLPVVAYDVGGLRECVRHGETGLLVPHGDVDGLTRALDDLLASQERRAAMGAAARAFSERFSIETVGARYLEFFDAMLRRKGGER